MCMLSFPDIRKLNKDKIGGMEIKLGFNIFYFQVSVKQIGRYMQYKLDI